jgi:hypothetical protein
MAKLNETDEGLSAFIPSDIATITVPGNSMIRDILVEEIANLNLLRPTYNLRRNQD